MIVIGVFLVASIVIGTIQLTTTPTEMFGPDFRGLPESQFPR